MNPDTTHDHDDRSTADAGTAHHSMIKRHLVFGWFALLLFLTAGLGLEAMHGLKVGFYLDASNETRRLLWTLAHSHGTLLAVVNIAFALTLKAVPGCAETRSTLASRCLIGAAVLLPAGFFLGGIFIFAGDPGLPIVLVPIGGLLLLVGVLMTGMAVRAAMQSQRVPETFSPPDQRKSKKKRG